MTPGGVGEVLGKNSQGRWYLNCVLKGKVFQKQGQDLSGHNGILG